MPTLERESLLEHLESEVAAYDAVLDGADLTARVPSCPGWHLADLTTHLGGAHRWALAALAQPPDTPPDESRLVGPPDGADAEAMRSWFAEGATQLLRALRETDPAAPAWAFGPRDGRVAAFWVRRMTQETAVHLWDGQSAVGAPGGLDAPLAADGVDEVVRMFVPRQVHLRRIAPIEQAVRLRATDTGDQWVIGEGEPVGEVAAPASDLLLLLWKRVPVEAATLGGDESAVRAVLATALTP